MNLTTSMMFKLVFLMWMTYHSAISQSEYESTTASYIVRSSNIVSKNIYKILARKSHKNILYCPVSTNILLALVTTAAIGKTAKELKTALHLNIRNEDIKSAYQILVKELHDEKLYLATRIFPKTGVKLVPEFAITAQTYFDSDVQAVNYYDPENAAEIINTFVEEKTKNKIHNLINAKIIDAMTRIVLVNAAYFRDRWLFNFENVLIGHFHLSKHKKVKTKLMSNTNYYKYKESTSLNAKVLQISFKRHTYSFLIILPNEIDGLHEMETKLASTNIDEIMNNLIKIPVKVTIPKFKIEVNINFIKVCEKLGIKKLFEEDANLDGLVKNHSLYVYAMMQKNVINVYENGVEAASATAMLSSDRTVGFQQHPQQEFTADHPFVFTIMRKNVIIFQGRLSKL